MLKLLNILYLNIYLVVPFDCFKQDKSSSFTIKKFTWYIFCSSLYLFAHVNLLWLLL